MSGFHDDSTGCVVRPLGKVKLRIPHRLRWRAKRFGLSRHELEERVYREAVRLHDLMPAVLDSWGRGAPQTSEFIWGAAERLSLEVFDVWVLFDNLKRLGWVEIVSAGHYERRER